MKQKYYIGELEFKTKKECENYTRNIITNLGCCIINKDHSQFIFFDNLIQNHPNCDDKKGIGIDYKPKDFPCRTCQKQMPDDSSPQCKECKQQDKVDKLDKQIKSLQRKKKRVEKE